MTGWGNKSNNSSRENVQMDNGGGFGGWSATQNTQKKKTGISQTKLKLNVTWILPLLVFICLGFAIVVW